MAQRVVFQRRQVDVFLGFAGLPRAPVGDVQNSSGPAQAMRAVGGAAFGRELAPFPAVVSPHARGDRGRVAGGDQQSAVGRPELDVADFAEADRGATLVLGFRFADLPRRFRLFQRPRGAACWRARCPRAASERASTSAASRSRRGATVDRAGAARRSSRPPALDRGALVAVRLRLSVPLAERFVGVLLRSRVRTSRGWCHAASACPGAENVTVTVAERPPRSRASAA